MKLNHINLTSRDVPADRAMFETVFGMTCTLSRGTAIAILRDEAGMLLFLNDFAKKRGDFRYPDDYDLHHIGFLQASREGVDAIWRRLTEAGWEVAAPRDYHGAWTFYFKAPGGFFVEVCTETDLLRG